MYNVFARYPIYSCPGQFDHWIVGQNVDKATADELIAKVKKNHGRATEAWKTKVGVL